MTVKKLSDAQKQAVVTIYTSNDKPKSIHELADLLGVSTRTIGRVLEEAGVTASKKIHTGEAAKVMRVLYKHKINADSLEAILNEPAMIPSNVSLFLKDCNRDQLYVILNGAGLITNADPILRAIAAQAVLGTPVNKPIPTKLAQIPLVFPNLDLGSST